MVNIQNMKREKEKLASRARDIVNSAEKEGRALYADEDAEFNRLMEQARELQVKIDIEERRQTAAMAATSVGTAYRVDPGKAFVESEAYNEMRRRNVWTSDPCQFRSIIASNIYDSAGGVAVATEFVPQIAGLGQQPLRVRDLLNVGRTSQNSVTFVRETGFTNAAAATKEFVNEGYDTAKPESTKTFESVVVPVETIAHWIPATRQIIADSPALASFVNNQLIYGLKLAEEDEQLNGSGVAPHLTGICPQATPYDDTLVAELGVTNPTNLDTLRAAIYQVQDSGYTADAVVLHPFDWAGIELLKGSDYKYIWVNVNDGGVNRVWKLPVVVSKAIAQGDFLVGAFKLGAQLWDREEASIRIAEQHEEFFTKNMVAILAEERLALTVYQPTAFVYGSFGYGS